MGILPQRSAEILVIGLRRRQILGSRIDIMLQAKSGPKEGASSASKSLCCGWRIMFRRSAPNGVWSRWLAPLMES